jgi:hypothetical protein
MGMFVRMTLLSPMRSMQKSLKCLMGSTWASETLMQEFLYKTVVGSINILRRLCETKVPCELILKHGCVTHRSNALADLAPADLASEREHKDIAGDLAWSHMTSHFSALAFKQDIMISVSASLAGKKSFGNCDRAQYYPTGCRWSMERSI